MGGKTDCIIGKFYYLVIRVTHTLEEVRVRTLMAACPEVFIFQTEKNLLGGTELVDDLELL